MSRKSGFNYFSFFEEMMGCATKSVTYLQKVLSDFHPEQLEDYRREMHQLEHEADLKKHEMLGCLMKEFLPPIDREDIVRIAHLLDELCDLAEEVILLLYMGDVRSCRPDAPGFTQVILRQCSELSALFARFGHYKKDSSLEGHIVVVNTIEEDGDRLYLESMRTLHTDGTSLQEQLSWRDIYACLEDCCDTCEKIADAAEEVLIKNA